MQRVVLLGAIVLITATACGKPGPKVYSATKTRACLVAQHRRVGPPPASDFVANTALGGSFKVMFASNFATVSFGNTVDNATKLDRVYQAVHTANVGIEDVLRMEGNAVMLWHAHPRDADLNALQGCLST